MRDWCKLEASSDVVQLLAELQSTLFDETGVPLFVSLPDALRAALGILQEAVLSGLKPVLQLCDDAILRAGVIVPQPPASVLAPPASSKKRGRASSDASDASRASGGVVEVDDDDDDDVEEQERSRKRPHWGGAPLGSSLDTVPDSPASPTIESQAYLEENGAGAVYTSLQSSFSTLSASLEGRPVLLQHLQRLRQCFDSSRAVLGACHSRITTRLLLLQNEREALLSKKTELEWVACLLVAGHPVLRECLRCCGAAGRRKPSSKRTLKACLWKCMVKNPRALKLASLAFATRLQRL